MARWALISAEDSAVRSACAVWTAEQFRQHGVRVAGFIQRRLQDEQDRKAYEMVRLSSEGAAPEVTERPMEGGLRHLEMARFASGIVTAHLATRGVTAAGVGQDSYCNCAFELDSFSQGRAWLQNDAPASQVVVLDSVSKLEAGRRGHHESVRFALSLPDSAVVILCVRSSTLADVLDVYDLADDPVASLELSTNGAAVGDDAIQTVPPDLGAGYAFVEQVLQAIGVQAHSGPLAVVGERECDS